MLGSACGPRYTRQFVRITTQGGRRAVSGGGGGDLGSAQGVRLHTVTDCKHDGMTRSGAGFQTAEQQPRNARSLQTVTRGADESLQT